jgi:ABC-2 type transport system ATP-binding protein
LLGPEGAGKSMALKIISGRVAATSGQVRVFGRRPSQKTAKARIAYFSTSSCELNVFGKIAKLLSNIVGRPNISDDRNAALRAALSPKCELLVFDEPFAGLNAKAKREMKELLFAAARAGKTVVFSSSSFDDVCGICHRICVLNSGELQAVGRINDFLESPEMVRFIAPVLSNEVMRRIASIVRAEADVAGEPHAVVPGSNDGSPLDSLLSQPKPAMPAKETKDPIDHDRLEGLTKPPSSE